MNPEARAVLETILTKGLNELTDADKAFLKARRSYLTATQKQDYKSILKEELETPVVEELGSVPAPEFPPKEVFDYKALLQRAKEFGHNGKRETRAKLEAFIASKN